MKSPRPAAVHPSKADKREAIMLAAEKLFTSRRFHEITLDDIVREAKVGKGTVYAYFKGKDDLFHQVAMSGFDELCDLLHLHISGDAPFESQLIQASEAISAFFERRKHLFRMIQSEDARMSLCRGNPKKKWQERRSHLVQALEQIIEKGRRTESVRRDISSNILARFLLALLRSRARDVGDEIDVPSVESLVSFFLSGASGGEASSPAADARSISESEES
jgi:AcrR family transcriptional regulator